MLVETRPSGAHRWTRCSAAPLFASRAGPQPDNDAAREGTCAAWVAEMVLTGHALSAFDMLGEQHSNGWQVDVEMCDHVQSYADMIRLDGGTISTERHVRLSAHVAGTLDNAASFTNGVLKVRDFKYGYRLVETDAEQLVIYAGALLTELEANGQEINEIWTEIYQPRGFHADGVHRRQQWTRDRIVSKCQWIVERAEECHKPNPLARPGAHCAHCEGAAGCEALHATTANLLTYVNSAGHREMTMAEVSERLTFLDEAKRVIDAATSAIQTEAETRVKAGERLPGYHMNERHGHRKFTVGADAIRALTGICPTKEVLMSPADLKKAGATDKQLGVITHRPMIGHKLKRLNQRDLERQFRR